MKRPPVVDVALAAAFACLGVADTFARLSPPSGTAPARTAVVPVLVVCVALALRRVAPLLTVLVVVAAIAGPALTGDVRLVYWGELVPWLFALYSLGRHDTRRRAVLGLVVTAIGFAGICVHYPDLREPGNAVYDLGLMVLVTVVGAVVRQRAALREESRRYDEERRRAVELATAAERSRIARELHDVISHGISVIVLQAGGARLGLDHDPEATRDALRRIEHAGRESLTELRLLLEVLRTDDLTPGTEESSEGADPPLPTLRRLDHLLEEHRRLGGEVRLVTSGELTELTELPLPVQLSAYRIVQEGLTNVLRHAGTVSTTVTLERGDVLVVDVHNERGCHDAAEVPRGGFGLLGLRERVNVLGGSLHTGSTPEGGFRLHAEIPLVLEPA